MTSRKSMPVTIPASQVHRRFSDLIRRAFSGEEHFIVEKDGLPVVAIISKAEYDELMQEKERREKDKQARLQRFEQSARTLGEEIEKRGLSGEEFMTDLEGTRQRLFEEQHGRKPKSRRA